MSPSSACGGGQGWGQVDSSISCARSLRNSVSPRHPDSRVRHSSCTTRRSRRALPPPRPSPAGRGGRLVSHCDGRRPRLDAGWTAKPNAIHGCSRLVLGFISFSPTYATRRDLPHPDPPPRAGEGDLRLRLVGRSSRTELCRATLRAFPMPRTIGAPSQGASS